MFQSRYTNEPASITARRAFIDTRLSFDRTCTDAAKLVETAAWEKRSKLIVDKSNTLRFNHSVKQSKIEALNERRDRLKQLLSNEEAELKALIVSQAETSEQRAARVYEQATKLRAARETKRAQQAAEAYDRQWKESCDDLRSIDSHYFTLHCKATQQQQIAEKNEFARARLAQSRAEDALAEQQRLQAVALAEAQAQARSQQQQLNQQALIDQIAATRALAEQMRVRSLAEREIALRLEELDRAAAQQKAVEEDANKRRANRENAAANLRLQQERREAYERERAQQRQALNQLMDEYRLDTEKQAAATAQWRADQNAYRLYLAHRKLEQIAQEREMDRLIEEDVAREEAKRDAHWSKEAEARLKLMDQVNQGRLQQIAERRRAREQELVQRQQDAQEVEAEIVRVAMLEQKEQKLQQDSRVQRAVEYESQMKLNAYRAERAAMEKNREERDSRATEAAYQTRLDDFRKQKIEESKQNYSIQQSSSHLGQVTKKL